MNYDRDGKAAGTATVHFYGVKDADVAMRKFGGVKLDRRFFCRHKTQRQKE